MDNHPHDPREQERELFLVDCVVYSLAVASVLRFALVCYKTFLLLARAQVERQTMPTSSTYPIDPLGQAFWQVLVIFSPSLALMWFSGVNWSIDTISNMLIFPKVYVLQLVLDKKYHLTPNGEIFLSFAVAICMEEVFRFAYWLRALEHYHRVGRNQLREIFIEQTRGSASPLYDNVSHFNKYQLRSIVLQLRSLLSDEQTGVAMRATLERRISEVQKELSQRTGPYIPPPPCTQCVVCLEREAEMQLHPCEHAPLCDECLAVWRDAETHQHHRYPLCPQCRTEVLSYTYRRKYERTLLTSCEYERQTQETTKRELASLYTVVQQNPALRSRLKSCPQEAFHSQGYYDRYSDSRSILADVSRARSLK